MSLADEFEADAIELITDFGEMVEYRPVGGTPRQIRAMINRIPVAEFPGTGPPRPSIRMKCLTDPVLGIDPATFDRRRDKLYVQYFVGQPNGNNDAPFSFSEDSMANTTGTLKTLLT